MIATGAVPTLFDAVLAIMIGLVSGVLSGLFGVGGGIVMTPGLQVMLGAAPIVALATPLPGDPADGAHRSPHLPQGRRARSTRSGVDDRSRCARIGRRRAAHEVRRHPSAAASHCVAPRLPGGGHPARLSSPPGPLVPGDPIDVHRHRARRRVRERPSRHRRRARDSADARRVARHAAETRARHVAARDRGRS